MAVSLSLFAGAGWQFFDNNGKILSGGNLYTYSAGTTTPLTTYTSSSGAVANTNPIVLDSAGRVPNEIWINTTVTAKFALYTSTGTLIGTWDNIPSYAAALNLTGTNNAVAYFNSVGTFTSSSNMTFDGSNLTVAGGITTGSNVAITGNISTTGTATFGGNTAVTGTLSATGGITSSTTAVTQAINDNSTKIATTAFVANAATKSKIQPISITNVTGGAFTIELAPTTLDFRDTSITTGTVTSVSNTSAITLTLQGARTLGATSGVQARLAIVAIYKSGISMELAVINTAGSISLDETTIISTLDITSGTSTATFYSTTARSNVAYRVVGFIDATNTSSVWAAPSLVQGAGGNSVVSLVSSIKTLSTASTSGSAIEFTNIPNNVKKITIGFSAVSLTGSDTFRFQLGTSTAYVTSGYECSAGVVSSSSNQTSITTAFGLYGGASLTTSSKCSGSLFLTLANSANNTWVASGVFGVDIYSYTVSGTVTLTDAVYKIKVFPTGANTFDAGTVSIAWDY